MKNSSFCICGGSPLLPEILQYYKMILQHPRIIVGDARFEPGTSAPEVWRAIPMSYHISMSQHIFKFLNFDQHMPTLGPKRVWIIKRTLSTISWNCLFELEKKTVEKLQKTFLTMRSQTLLFENNILYVYIRTSDRLESWTNRKKKNLVTLFL